MHKVVLSSLLLILLLISPLSAHAFIEFCFPISFTFLAAILSWPSMLLYEISPSFSFSQNLTIMFILGFLVDLLITFAISILIGRYKAERDLPFYKKFKLPIFFIVLVILLLILSYLDPTCWQTM